MEWCGGSPRSRRAALCAVVVCLLAGCSAARPTRPGDLCSIFAENPDWYEEARDSYRRWGVPVPVQLAVIHHESGFRADARPPRRWYLGFIPGLRPSSAYGYGQVLDGTWDWYRDSAGSFFASRDDFGDVADFIGWYGHVGERRHGIRKDDAYSFYLSYLLGHAGYRRFQRRRSASAHQAASAVVAKAKRYESQYQRCRPWLDAKIDDDGGWPFG